MSASPVAPLRFTPAQPPLHDRYAAVRAATLRLAEGLSAEDCQVQSMPDASPVKWHLAHTTWFFETFVLERHERSFKPFDPAFRTFFNSYHHAVGDRHPRPQRGLVTRPGLDRVLAYRAEVDERMAALRPQALAPDEAARVELGLQHEQQHQELILTDLKHLLSCNPTQPVYCQIAPPAGGAAVALQWVGIEGGLVEVGHGGTGLAFDDVTPRHRAFLPRYALSNTLVTNGDWLEFVAAGGYRDPRWWLSAGWDWVRTHDIEAPLNWERPDTHAPRCSFTLHGKAALDPHAPVVHVSYFDADADCRWRAASDPRFAGARLPTEAEWKHAAAGVEAAAILAGQFVDRRVLQPKPAADARPGLKQMFGTVWQWTASSYGPYPGFTPWSGALGEYDGKFMVNQLVLRGGSCATPRPHIRATYRNFSPAEARWQFSGLRLARDGR